MNIAMRTELKRELKQELGQILMLAAADFQTRLDADLRSRGVTGIRNRHRAVFLHLGRFGPSRSVDLAQAAGIRPQSMMAIIHELEHTGLLERRADPADSRAKLIYFTAEGQHFITELGRSTENVWDQYTAVLGGPALASTIASLQKILAQQPTGENS
jgi:DNA-binding MarR family transcriptional regulator